jgi:chemotaxis signal transduction protein
MTERADELRDAFDRGFAAPIAPPEPAHRDYLCIRVAGTPAAIALGDVASLHAGLRIVALPTRASELLGVAAIRAAIVPIYDLGIAFGTASTAATRWIAVVAGSAAGFAFEGFDGHLRVAERAIAATAQADGRTRFLLGGQLRSVIDLRSVLAAIEARWRQISIAKEP